MWYAIELTLLILLFVVTITQVIIPSFIPSVPYFWLFRRKKKEELDENGKPLNKEYNEVKKKVEETNKAAEKLKSKAESKWKEADEFLKKSKEL